MKIIRLLAMLVLIFNNFKLIAQVELSDGFDKVFIKLDPRENATDISFLDSVLNKNQILALGESSHGTSDFFKMKFKIIKYCIINLGYKSIGIEADCAGTRLMNDYIVSGKTSIDEAIYKMGIAAWMTEEMKEIILWLKDYNQNKKVQDKIKFWGFDMQFSNHTIELLKINLAKYPNLDKAAITFLDTLKYLKSPEQFKNPQLSSLIKQLNQISYKMSDIDKQETLQLIQLLSQTILFKSTNEFRDKLRIRDSCLFQNVQTFMNLYSEKAILWAHNGHIAKSKHDDIWKPMGCYLKESIGSAYYSLGLMTGSGSIGFYNRITKNNDSLQIPHDKRKKSYDRFFANYSNHGYYVDIASTFNNPNFKDQFTQKKLIRTIDLNYFSKQKNTKL